MIMILGGTSDSYDVALRLDELKIDYFIFVTTKYGYEIIKNLRGIKKLTKLDYDDMVDFIKLNNINILLDFTHPYAIEASKNAIKACDNTDIKYIRYERKSLNLPKYDRYYMVKDYDESINIANKIGQKIFLSTGSKTLDLYVNNLESKKLYARVLPTKEVIEKCYDLGLLADQIIAMKGPFDEELNNSMFKFLDVDTLITKESGQKGGYLEKINAGIKNNLNIIIIKRQTLDYKNIYNEIDDVIDILEG